MSTHLPPPSIRLLWEIENIWFNQPYDSTLILQSDVLMHTHSTMYVSVLLAAAYNATDGRVITELWEKNHIDVCWLCGCTLNLTVYPSNRSQKYDIFVISFTFVTTHHPHPHHHPLPTLSGKTPAFCVWPLRFWTSAILLTERTAVSEMVS